MTEIKVRSNAEAAHRDSKPALLLRNTKSSSAKVRRYPLQQFRLSIGRSPEDHICLSEGSGVSRQHASVLALDGEVVIEDLGSRNGTYVNRKLIRGSRQTTLKFGDVITIGRYRLKLVDEAAAADSDGVKSVNSLLRAWSAVPVSAHAESCALCHAPRVSDADVERDATATISCAAAAEQGVASDNPVASDTETSIICIPDLAHGRAYGRKLSRRPLLAKRPVMARRSALASARRLSVAVMSARGGRGQSASLH